MADDPNPDPWNNPEGTHLSGETTEVLHYIVPDHDPADPNVRPYITRIAYRRVYSDAPTNPAPVQLQGLPADTWWSRQGPGLTEYDAAHEVSSREEWDHVFDHWYDDPAGESLMQKAERELVRLGLSQTTVDILLEGH